MHRLDSENLDMIISTLRDYAERELKPERLLELDRLNEFPEQVHRDLYGEIGLHLLFIPEEFGGMGGGAHDIYRVSEVLARIDLGIATSILATFLGTDPITVGGTPEQKKQWMGRIAEEGLLVAYGATEPQAGSDLTSLKTRAKPTSTRAALPTRSTARSSGSATAASRRCVLILANAPGGASWFVVERGTPGLTPGKHEDKHGIRASNTTALFLDNVIVPAENLVGGVEGLGFAQAQAVFGYTRLMVASFGLGGGWSALERAIRYAQERVVGGGPLMRKQGFTHKLLVPNAVRLEAARAYIEWTAERIDGGEPNLATEGAIAKYLATEAGNRAAEDAIQALGGNGYTREYMVEKIKRDVRITTIYEGTSEILEWTIGARPLAAAPQVAWRALPRLGAAGSRHSTPSAPTSGRRARRSRCAPSRRSWSAAAPTSSRGTSTCSSGSASCRPCRGGGGLRRARGDRADDGHPAAARDDRRDVARVRPRGRRARRVRGRAVGDRRRADRPGLLALDRLEPGPRRTGRRDRGHGRHRGEPGADVPRLSRRGGPTAPGPGTRAERSGVSARWRAIGHVDRRARADRRRRGGGVAAGRSRCSVVLEELVRASVLYHRRAARALERRRVLRP